MSLLAMLLDAGVDPVEVVGSFDHLEDLVLSVAAVPLERRAQVAERRLVLAADPHVRASRARLEPRVRAQTAACDIIRTELLLDAELLARLLDEHPRRVELEAAVRCHHDFNRPRIGTVDASDAERGFPAGCVACGHELEPGARALMLQEARACLPCSRGLLADLDEEVRRG